MVDSTRAPTSAGSTTCAFSEEYIDARRRLAETADISNEQFTNFTAAMEAAAIVPIHQVDADDIGCRILLRLDGSDGSMDVRGGEWTTLPVLPTTEHSWDKMATARCMSVTQSETDVSCLVLAPIHCELFYDAGQDSVQLFNRSSYPFCLEPLPKQTTRVRLENHSVEPYGVWTLKPGAWRLRGPESALQLRVFPRRHSAIVVRRQPTQDAAGSKRPRIDREPTTSTTSNGAARGLEMAKSVSSLTDTNGGDEIHLETATNSFSLVRLQDIARKGASHVFLAKHSTYPDRVIVVKTFAFDPSKGHHDPMYRASCWNREYTIHRRLDCGNIVMLLGGDARFEVLFLDYRNAHDLSKSRWCNTRGDWMFTGTVEDAQAVLVDMTKALGHLREKGILHNDIKPGNILYGSMGAVLIDFGLGSEDGSRASAGGTPWYVPPEYLTAGQRGAPADVWALGIVMIYLLRQVPLPDSGRQAAHWIISRANQQSMRGWLNLVETVRTRLGRAEEEDWMSKLVAGMLDGSPQSRLTPKDLERAKLNGAPGASS